jgi:hypothetical protein
LTTKQQISAGLPAEPGLIAAEWLYTGNISPSSKTNGLLANPGGPGVAALLA